MCIPLGLIEIISLLVVFLMAIYVIAAGCYKFITCVLGKTSMSDQRKQHRPGPSMRHKITWDKQKPT